MNSPNQKPVPLSWRKRLVFSMITAGVAIAVLGISIEIMTRAKGHKPLQSVSNFVSLEPAGKYFVKDPTRGWTYEPGDFTILLATNYRFRVSHMSNGLRRTAPANAAPQEKRNSLWIFGCSITHGFSLNDEETYPWLLQQSLPDYEVVNFGVDGYGTVQSLVQLRESLETGNKPRIVVLAYSSGHDIRNTLARIWRKGLLSNNRIGPLTCPYADMEPGGKLLLRTEPLEYPGFFLTRYSAFANYLDDQYILSLLKRDQSHEVTRLVISEFWRLCKDNGIDFVLAGITKDPLTAEMLAWFDARGAMTVDISIDWSIRANLNLPHDPHPSPVANKQFAEKLEAYLRSKLLLKENLSSPEANSRR